MSSTAEALEKTIEPGLYSDIPNNEYHGGPGLSSSGVKKILRSPLHYWEEYLNPEHERKEDTDALLLGSVVHTLVLEPEKFEQEWAVAPDVNKRTKDGKAQWASFLAVAEKEKKTVIKPAIRDQATTIANAVKWHPKASQIFTDGVPEQSLYWIDPDTGVLCKCRPDWWRSNLIADLKTAIDASEEGFMRATFNMGYHISAAFYLDGVKEMYGDDLSFIFSVVEKEAPFAVANYRIHDEAIALGRKQYKQALETYARCIEKGTERKHWPGYPLELQTLNLPGWAYKKAQL